jgi:hypothetical protein
VHRVAMIDLMRDHPRETLTKFFPPGETGAPANMPASVRVLSTLFMPPENGKRQSGATKAAASAVKRVLGIK